jgi:3-phenylpropionate/trans-cinnamate dioxygenase ferredoxin reductase component
MSVTDRVVVVGGGLAATRCLEQLRLGDPERELVLISDEVHLPYDRPPLTKTALKDGSAPPQLNLKWDELNIDTRLGLKAVALNPADKTVELADGSTVEYGVLVITTGAGARRLPGLQGGQAEGVHVVRDAEDALALHAALLANGRITIIGAGFIGCEAASTARALNAEVTLLEALPAPLSRVLGEQIGSEIAERHRRDGVDVRTNAMVTEVRGSGAERELLLTDGSTVAAPVVLVALGARPAVEWLDGSGIAVKHGVLCDDEGRTNLPDVYAAGDAAVWRQPSTGTHDHVEHWTSATSQARTVAKAILGGGEPLDEVHYFWSDQVGVKMQMMGTPGAEDEVTVIPLTEDGARFIALYGRDGRLTASFGIGAARHIMSMRAKIAAGADYAGTVAEFDA